jgi:predicted secreted hydrolase
MAHFGLSWADGHLAHQRYARGGEFASPSGGIAQAGAAEPFTRGWMTGVCAAACDWLPLEMRARQDGNSVRLTLASDLPPVLQGDRGFSQKHPDGTGSHYYSQPFLAASGEIELNGRTIEVSGQAWLDREWSSQYLQPDQVGWDWFALHLESGEKLMLFQLRPRLDGATEPAAGQPYRHGVLISPGGDRQVLDPAGLEFEVVERTRVAGRSLPLHWRIELPGIDRRLDVVALHPDQWMPVDFPYWEGVVQVSGDDAGSRGWGYLELTGYVPEN